MGGENVVPVLLLLVLFLYSSFHLPYSLPLPLHIHSSLPLLLTLASYSCTSQQLNCWRCVMERSGLELPSIIRSSASSSPECSSCCSLSQRTPEEPDNLPTYPCSPHSSSTSPTAQVILFFPPCTRQLLSIQRATLVFQLSKNVRGGSGVFHLVRNGVDPNTTCCYAGIQFH